MPVNARAVVMGGPFNEFWYWLNYNGVTGYASGKYLALDKLRAEPHGSRHRSVVLERCLHKVHALVRARSSRDVAHADSRRLHLARLECRDWSQGSRVVVASRQVEQEVTHGDDAQLSQQR